MEKIILIALLLSLPASCFMIAADITGQNKWIARLFMKLPSYMSIVLLLVYILKYFNVEL
jgi:hypothetical protein